MYVIILQVKSQSDNIKNPLNKYNCIFLPQKASASYWGTGKMNKDNMWWFIFIDIIIIHTLGTCNSTSKLGKEKAWKKKEIILNINKYVLQ